MDTDKQKQENVFTQMEKQLSELQKKLDIPESREFIEKMLSFKACVHRYSMWNTMYLFSQVLERQRHGEMKYEPSVFASFAAYLIIN